MINFNNAGCSNLVKPTFDIISEVTLLERDQCGYDIARKYEKEMNDFYNNVSKLINCHKDEVAFTQSST